MRQLDGTEALERARAMRRRPTEAEDRLWHRLRGRRLGGYKFRRQVWIGPFIPDFLCVEAMLIVEVDGSQHVDGANYDADRTAYLTDKGYRVIRVWNNDVMQRLEDVLTAIHAALITVPSPSHSASPSGSLPLPGGEKER